MHMQQNPIGGLLQGIPQSGPQPPMLFPGLMPGPNMGGAPFMGFQAPQQFGFQPPYMQQQFQ